MVLALIPMMVIIDRVIFEYILNMKGIVMKPVTLDKRQLLGYRIAATQSRQKLGGKIGDIGKVTITTQAADIGRKGE